MRAAEGKIIFVSFFFTLDRLFHNSTLNSSVRRLPRNWLRVPLLLYFPLSLSRFTHILYAHTQSLRTAQDASHWPAVAIESCWRRGIRRGKIWEIFRATLECVKEREVATNWFMKKEPCARVREEENFFRLLACANLTERVDDDDVADVWVWYFFFL